MNIIIFLDGSTKEDKLNIDLISQQDNISEQDIQIVDNIAEKIILSSVSIKLKELNITSEKDKNSWLFENAYRITRTTASNSVHKLAMEKKYIIQMSYFL